MSHHHLLSRYRQLEVRAEINRHVARTVLSDPSQDHPLRPGAIPGDARALRGIPAVGVKGGLGGAILGTRPDRTPLDRN